MYPTYHVSTGPPIWASFLILYPLDYVLLPLFKANCTFFTTLVATCLVFNMIGWKLTIIFILYRGIFLHILYSQKLAQCFHSLNWQNLKIGPCHRNYASIQFWARCYQLNSHSNAMMYAHMITLKWKENSWDSLFHNCPNMGLSFSFLHGVFHSLIDHLATVFLNIRPVMSVTDLHDSSTPVTPAQL